MDFDEFDKRERPRRKIAEYFLALQKEDRQRHDDIQKLLEEKGWTYIFQDSSEEFDYLYLLEKNGNRYFVDSKYDEEREMPEMEIKRYEEWNQ